MLSCSKGEVNNLLYFKIKEQQKEDFQIISKAQEMIKSRKEDSQELGDLYVPGCIGISVDDS